MAGSVWEWTASFWGADWEKPVFGYPYDASDGREDMQAAKDALRVVRGGSWDGILRIVRCACRRWVDPDGRGSIGGFRVCASPI